MEKAIKVLSLSLSAVIATFVIVMVAAVNAEAFGLPSFIYQFFVVGANVLLYLIPVAYLFMFGFGLSNLLKRAVVKKGRMVTARRAEEKFPIFSFLTANGLFVVFIIFVSAIFTA
ncbi:MAG: hypothetical protein E7256_04900 [Lachnospiraceae bacterium]|nr:hypothetical protein [Lachnospiraceae bacterium]